ncbi:MAG: tRNA (adenosine(37)-N6)-threonylcarbamoyltransferase complex transferase subunit TsaD [Desulfofustis sp.]|nr:tRNA (adenosine(37)-N6)-threonylcarbamoyltransferase complex transferase subunit TsaD [Desulfofustis sp.]
MIVLGIETSCDDTAVAVLDSEASVLANVVSSQDKIHQRFGGIVPELASRRHMESITPIVNDAISRAGITLNDIELIAVTRGPGLIGSLLVGFCYAKSLSYTLGIPYVGVDHMAGHLLSAFLEHSTPAFPYIALIVSGGTTSLFKVEDFNRFDLLGRTRDDAAGEAFDKIARYLELGYPGGPVVSKRAEGGDTTALQLPRAWLEEGSLDFSFSGLKTSVINHCHRIMQVDHLTEQQIMNTCASFQQAVIDVLIEKTSTAAQINDIRTVVLGGGVSANRSLREQMSLRCGNEELDLFLPSVENCTDNGAMIAFAGVQQYWAGDRGANDDDVYSRSHLGR